MTDISLYQPSGIENLAVETGSNLIDRPHVTLFVVNPSEADTEETVKDALGRSVGFIRDAIRKRTLTATITKIDQFMNTVWGFRLNFDAAAVGTFKSVAVFLANRGNIPNPEVGDRIDQQNGDLHMALVQDRGGDVNSPFYKKIVSALKDYVGRTITFGDVRYTLSSASTKPMITLANTNVVAYREHLRSWSYDDLTSNFIDGLSDHGVDEIGLPTTAGDLMYEEYMLREGCYDDVTDINRIKRAEGNDNAVRHNTHMSRIAAARVAEDADDGSIYR